MQLSPEARIAARELYGSKEPTCRRCAEFLASRVGLNPIDAADLVQEAMLRLWRTCCQWITESRTDEISCQWVVRACLNRRGWDRGCHVAGMRPQSLSRLSPTKLDALLSPTVAVHTDGVRISLTDACLDEPNLRLILEDPVTLLEAAELLDLTPQGVRDMQERDGDSLCGIRVDGRWLFARSLVTDLAKRRGAFS